MRPIALAATVAGLLAFTPAAHAQLKIGVAGPFTGALAAYGDQMRSGVEEAVKAINAEGGIGGQQVEIVLGDDQADPRQGISVANKFAAEGVKFVVGHINSGVSIPASEVYLESGILQISPASTNPTYTERGMWNTFRTCGRDDQQGAVAGAYLAVAYKGKNIAVLHDKTPYGQGLAMETQKALNAAGLKEVMFEGINVGEKDFSALVGKLKQSKVDAVYFGGVYTEAALILRQMHDQALKIPLMSGDGIASSEFAAIAGDSGIGTLMTFSPDPRKNPAAAEAVAKFNARGVDPEAYTLYSYAAMQIIKSAAEAAGSDDPQKAAAVIHSGKTFETVIGALAYDSKGDVTRPDYIVYEWRKNAEGVVSYTGNEVEH
jgi:branched-chain amino acid transport system substrate-binding protein